MKKLLIALLLCSPFMMRAQGNKQRIDSLQQQLDLHKQDDSVKVGILIGLANAYRHNEPNRALGYSQKALGVSENIGYKSGIAHAYNNLGLIYDRLGLYAEALRNDSIALKKKHELNDMHGVGGVLCNIGMVYLNKKDYARSVEILDDAKQTLEAVPGNHDKDEYLANVFMNLGTAYIKQVKAVSAGKAFEDAGKIYERLGYKEKMASAYVRVAATKVVLEQFDDARTYANKAIVIGHELNDEKIIEQANKVLDKTRENDKR